MINYVVLIQNTEKEIIYSLVNIMTRLKSHSLLANS